MPGPAPKENRRRANEPASGEWKEAPGVGWQHGEVPEPPDCVAPEVVEAWDIWMGSWFAAFWTPEDLPGLRVVAKLYDQVERGDFVRAAELRIHMKTYGITPEGQQKLHWKPPRDFREDTQPRSRKVSKGRRESSLEVIQGGK